MLRVISAWLNGNPRSQIGKLYLTVLKAGFSFEQMFMIVQLNFSIFKHKLVVEQEMLYYASVVMGQSLMKNMQGKNEIRRDALVCFVNACRYTVMLSVLVLL